MIYKINHGTLLKVVEQVAKTMHRFIRIVMSGTNKHLLFYMSWKNSKNLFDKGGPNTQPVGLLDSWPAAQRLGGGSTI